ncbi:MAG: hypothetical protein ACRELA_03105 [Candidatus Rokuibacteriota bacterium]
MRTLSPEQLLLLLAVFLLVLLLNFLLAVWRRPRRASTAVRQLEPVAQEAPAQATRPRSVQAARIGRLRRETPGVLIEPAPGSRRLTPSARLGPRDARRGVVLMAILGPCRAFEPQHPPVPEARGPVAPPSVGR